LKRLDRQRMLSQRAAGGVDHPNKLDEIEREI